MILAEETRKAQEGRPLWNPDQVAKFLGMSRSNVYHLAASGEIKSIKFGKAVRFRPADVDRFIRDHRRKAG